MTNDGHGAATPHPPKAEVEADADADDEGDEDEDEILQDVVGSVDDGEDPTQEYGLSSPSRTTRRVICMVD